MILSRKDIMEGVKIPAWYYGLAYADYETASRIFYPMPLNYIIRIAMRIQYIWGRFRSKPTWFDREIEKGIRARIDLWETFNKKMGGPKNKP